MVFERKQKRRNLDGVDALDRISQLPEHIIHHILFLMPHKDAARTTVLSKSWKQVWNSLPRYDFTFCDGTYYDNSPAHFEKKIEKFVRSVNEDLLPLREHKTTIQIVQQFRLRMTLCHHKYASRIDNWIKLANRNLMESLYLELTSMNKVGRYVLPKTTFFVESLAELTLKGCKVLGNYFGDDMIKSIYLRKLTLERVDVNYLTITKILRCCPLLEEFTQSNCCVKAKRVHINYAPKLKKAKLYGVKKIKIEAPNLEELYCRGDPGRLDSDSFACNNVKKLKISMFETSKLFEDLNSKFPLLETLDLQFYDSKLKISSDRLKSLSLLCPNKQLPMLQISFSPEELSKDLPIPPIATVEHLELGNVPIMQDYTALLDGLLWSCHPKVLLIRADSESKEFVNFLSETLVIKEEEPKCCGDSHMKCWRHYLKAVKSEPYLDGMEYVKVCHCDALSDSISALEICH
ncbi:F-box/LRR-repeat protein At3g26922-like [Quercus robur]|uniref:F-box/LRR-repeat protein At3g26922-like n=1 Tax=Quercus robur TaxID=38942 RepID=UPI002161A294|nr:F-box/LRR-repeat protein At3g26922-like [Quercus robur]